MDVRVDEAWSDHAAADIDNFSATGDRTEDLAIIADGCDHAGFDAHAGRGWVQVYGPSVVSMTEDPRVHEYEWVGPSHAASVLEGHSTLRRSASNLVT